MGQNSEQLTRAVTFMTTQVTKSATELNAIYRLLGFTAICLDRGYFTNILTIGTPAKRCKQIYSGFLRIAFA